MRCPCSPIGPTNISGATIPAIISDTTINGLDHTATTIIGSDVADATVFESDVTTATPIIALGELAKQPKTYMTYD